MNKKLSLLVICASMTFMGGTHSAFALDNSAEWSGISFDFTNPGARARGIGGAFVAVADDASAMVSNPAGLNNLERPQIVIEGKYFSSTPDDDVNSGSWIDAKIDREDTDFTDLTYFSLSTPILDKKFNLGLFYNQNMHSESKMDIQYALPLFGINDFYTFFNVDTVLNVDQFGMAFAGSAWDGKLKLGISLSYMDLNIDSSFRAMELYGTDYTLKPYNLQNVGNGEYAVGFGILIEPIDKLTVGFNANILPSFDVTSHITQGDWDDTSDSNGNNSFALGQYWDPDTFAHCTSGPDGRSYSCDSEFSMPDTYSIGVSYRPSDNWLFSVEGKFVKYSELVDSFRAPYRYFLWSWAEEFDIDDVWELHGGMEYLTFIKERPLAFRLGVWLDPAHELKYTGEYAAYGLDDTATKGLFDGGDDQTHITAGVGTLISDSFQFDMAVDYCEASFQIVASAGYRF